MEQARAVFLPAQAADSQRRFVLFSLTPEGTLRFRPNARSLTPVPLFSGSATRGEEKKKSMQEAPKEEQQPSQKQPEKDEGTEFANRCVVEVYASSSFRRSGVYALG